MPKRLAAVFWIWLVGPFFVGNAQAAVPRTFVASRGLDWNTRANCSRTAPCRTLSAALSVTDPGGEVVVLDSAEYGMKRVTITQAVSILVPAGIYAGISGGGVEINAPGGEVFLRGLSIENQGNPGGGSGVWIIAANSVTIDNCAVKGFFFGIYASGVSTQVIVKSSSMRSYNVAIVLQDGPTGIIRDVTFDGTDSRASVLSLHNLASGSTSAFVDNSVVVGGAQALSVGAVLAGGAAIMSVTHSRIVAAQVGVLSYSIGGGTANAIVDHSTISGSKTAGLASLGSNSRILIDQDEITGNAIGSEMLDFGVVGTLGNNSFLSNGADVVGGALNPIADSIK